MLTLTEIEAIAARYDEAERTRTQMRAPTLDHPGMTIEDAYAAQKAWVDLKISCGDPLIGHKIGLTSRAMQQAVQIDEPDFGALLESMYFEDGAVIPADRFIIPRVEVELGFQLKKPLQGTVSVFDVIDATDFVVPAFEIIDARSHSIDPETKRPRLVMDTIADNAANAGVIWGGRAVKPTAIDLRWVPGVLYQNGKIEETGVAMGVMGDPVRGVAWLAKRLSDHGAGLEAGEFILSGSFTRPIHAARGDVIHCDFGPLGAITCSFARE